MKKIAKINLNFDDIKTLAQKKKSEMDTNTLKGHWLVCKIASILLYKNMYTTRNQLDNTIDDNINKN